MGAWSRSKFARAALAACTITAGLAGTASPAAATTTWNTGDVFVGISGLGGLSGGQYKIYDSAGNLKETINAVAPSPAGGSRGCAFNNDESRLYSTNFDSAKVEVFDTASPHAVVQTSDTLAQGGGGAESITFASNGDFYVGHANGNGDIQKFNAAGQFVEAYDVELDDRGSDWIDLASDQKTIYYTSEGSEIKRYDVSTRTQLPDFAVLSTTGFFGAAFALRVLESGEVLVADSADIKLVAPGGAVVRTFTVPGESSWFAVNLDPNGTSFWSAGLGSSKVYKFNLATGAVELTIDTGAFGSVGLCLKGELTGGTRVVGRKLKYIGLGDSYASGEGNTPYESDVCHRSAPRGRSIIQTIKGAFGGSVVQGAYPNAVPAALLAEVPRSVVKKLSVTAGNQACSGATTDDIRRSQHPGVRAQADTVRDKTDVLTVSIGGNDIGLSGVLALCLVRESCFDPPTERDVERCERAVRNDKSFNLAPFRCDVDLNDAVDEAIDRLHEPGNDDDDMDRALKEIAEQADEGSPEPTLKAVVGYPEIFPTDDEVGERAVDRCAQVRSRRSSLGRGSISRTEMNDVLGFLDELNAAIEAGARENGFIFVDIAEALDGHELCTRSSWVRGLPDDSAKRRALHPTPPGQQAMGEQVADKLFPMLDFKMVKGGGGRGEG